jgi:RND family efflux transporter MFP subunit
MSLGNDKSSLLNSLKIARGAAPRRRGPSPWIYAGIAVLAIGAGGTCWLFWPDTSVAVHVVTASALDSGPAAGAGLDASGYIVARRKATLSAKILGKLTEVNFEEGQQVKAGDVVARLEDSNYTAALRQAEATARQAKINFDNTAPIFERYARLKQLNAISTDAVDNQRLTYDNARMATKVTEAAVALARSNVDDTVVKAPFSGIVTVKVAQVGEIVAPAAAGGGDTRTGIVTIVDMGSLEVQVDVAENYIDRVQTDGSTIIHLDAYPDWDIPGSVIAIIPTADQSKGTVEVRVAIKMKDKRILPQMAARVTFLTAPEDRTPKAASSVTVPLRAVLAHGKTGSVFVVGEDGKVKKREVTLGLKAAQAITILSGISPGDRLAADNLEKLRDGDRVKLLERN